MRNLFIVLNILLFTFVSSGQIGPSGLDVSYGPHFRQKLDYWIAKEPNSPILLLIHGGAWQLGDKNDEEWDYASQLFFEQGYAVVNINYVLATDEGYGGIPHQLSDIACALAWTKTNQLLLNGDASRLVLFGNSAGAHLASLIGLYQNPLLLSNCSFQSSLSILAVIALSGVYDYELVPQNNYVSHQVIKTMVGDSASYWELSQPINNVNDLTGTKFLLIHGSEDFVVGKEQANHFNESLISESVCSRLSIINGRGHDFMEGLGDDNDPVRKRVMNYLDSLLNNLICNVITSEDLETEKVEVKIIINDRNEYIIESNINALEVKRCRVFSLAGVQMYNNVIGFKSKPIVRLNNLNPGIYIVSLCLTNGAQIKRKIVVPPL